MILALLLTLTVCFTTVACDEARTAVRYTSGHSYENGVCAACGKKENE